jgi:hypothetical protein
MMPELGFMDFFDRDTTPDDMAKAVACFVEKS